MMRNLWWALGVIVALGMVVAPVASVAMGLASHEGTTTVASSTCCGSMAVSPVRTTSEPPSQPLSGSTAGPSPNSISPSSDPAQGPGSVIATLVLSNGSVVPGNFLSANSFYPSAVAFDPTNHYVYVVNSGSDSVAAGNVSVINGTTGKVVARIPVGRSPEGVAVDRANGYVYVTNSESGNVSVINGAIDQVVGSISVGGMPVGVAVDPANGYVYVASGYSDYLSVINGTTNTMVGTITVGNGPWTLAVDAANGYVFVANTRSNNVTVIDGRTDQVIGSVPVGNGPWGVAVDPANGLVYTTNRNSSNITVINGTTDHELTAGIPTGLDPQGVAFDAASKLVYVTCGASDNLTVISGSPGRSIGSIPVGHNPDAVAVDGVNGYLYVTNYASDNVSVINGTSAVVGSLLMGSSPQALAVDPANGVVYVTNWVGQDLIAINGATDTVNGSIAAATDSYPYPDAVAVHGGNGDIYVANWGMNDVTVVNGATDKVVASVPVGIEPGGVAVDGANGYVYVTNSGGANVSVINGATNGPVGSIPVGEEPWGIAVDARNGYIYVSVQTSCHLTIINGSTNVVVGSIAGLCGGRGGITVDPFNGDIYVASGYQNVSVINATTDTVVRLIPVGTAPYGMAVDDANGYVYVTNSGTNDVTVINGSTNTVVGSIPVGVEPNGVSVDRTNGLIYVANWISGSISVISPPVHSVTFQETGLPAGRNWTVDLNGTNETSAGSAITFTEPNGEYAFTVGPVPGYLASPRTGYLTVNDYNAVVGLVFYQLCSVRFSESGLPAKALAMGWTVEFNGTVQTLTNTSTVFVVPVILYRNYSYLVAGPSGYVVTGSAPSGALSVHNASMLETFDLSKGKAYALTFTEKGLPKSGGVTQSWCVEVSGWARCSTRTSTTFVGLTAGNYSYGVVSPRYGWTITARIGSGTVPAWGAVLLEKNTKVAFTFAYLYPVVFRQTGLVGSGNGTLWSVTVKGHTETAEWNGTIRFGLANGSYGYKIGTVAGYTGKGSPKSVTVNGAGSSVSVTFTKRT